MNYRILFFAPAFFGYEYKIADKMKELGNEVFLYDERSVASSFERALLKISPAIFKRKTEKYYRDIIEQYGDDIDIVLFIKGEMVTECILKEMKSRFSKAKFHLYLYDSLRNVKGIEGKLEYFDKIYSFDRKDCLNNSNIHFRPLFFCDEYISDVKYSDIKWDISFCGTIHSDRYDIIRKIQKYSESAGLKLYFYGYLQSKFIYYYYKLLKKSFKHTKSSDFRFDKISSGEIAQIVDDSNAILDIQHPNQTGLTMRTIEMVGMRKKIVTTNQEISEYDFYNSNNILIIDRELTKISRIKDFLAKKYQEIDEKIYNKYSLECWVDDVLEGE